MKCPGQDSRYWKPDAIFEAKCPKCENAVEFFKDDTTRRCKRCGHRFLNPALDFGCASYCKYVEQCIGNLPPELIAQKEGLLKDRVAIEVKRRLKRDFKAIGRAIRRARYAEKIGTEEGGNLAVILSAAYLFGLGGEDLQDGKKDPAAAEEILSQIGAAETLIEEVSRILAAHHRPGKERGTEAQCVHDADRLARLEDDLKRGFEEGLSPAERIESRFFTPSGRRLAEEMLGQASQSSDFRK